MKKLMMLTLLLTTSMVYAADYDYIDPGDYYYINRFGDDNPYVVVVRKMGNQKVKVRDVNTGDTMVVDASALLTKSQLESQEWQNTLGGAAVGATILYCIFTNNCKK